MTFRERVAHLAAAVEILIRLRSPTLKDATDLDHVDMLRRAEALQVARVKQLRGHGTAAVSALTVVLIAVLASCSLSTHVAQVAANGALAADWWQTRREASAGWRDYAEENALMGSSPDPVAVDGYMALCAGGANLVGAALPKEWMRTAWFAGVALFEGEIVRENWQEGDRP